MAYTKTTWATGDVVTSAKLNHIEDGIANASGSGTLVIRVNFVDENDVLDKTWKEIFDVIKSGTFAFVLGGGENEAFCAPVTLVSNNDDETFIVEVLEGTEIASYTTDSENGYPVYSA